MALTLPKKFHFSSVTIRTRRNLDTRVDPGNVFSFVEVAERFHGRLPQVNIDRNKIHSLEDSIWTTEMIEPVEKGKYTVVLSRSRIFRWNRVPSSADVIRLCVSCCAESFFRFAISSFVLVYRVTYPTWILHGIDTYELCMRICRIATKWIVHSWIE